jgi:hypothetical protein
VTTEGPLPFAEAKASAKGEALATILHDVNTVIVCLNIWDGYLPKKVHKKLIENLEKVANLIESLE